MNDFTYKLIKQNENEGTLIVEFNFDNRITSYYANVISFNKLICISEKLKIGNRKYFYRNNLLIIRDLTNENLAKVIQELESTGDLFDVMESLTVQSKVVQYIKFKIRKFRKWINFD